MNNKINVVNPNHIQTGNGQYNLYSPFVIFRKNKIKLYIPVSFAAEDDNNKEVEKVCSVTEERFKSIGATILIQPDKQECVRRGSDNSIAEVIETYIYNSASIAKMANEFLGIYFFTYKDGVYLADVNDKDERIFREVNLTKAVYIKDWFNVPSFSADFYQVEDHEQVSQELHKELLENEDQFKFICHEIQRIM